MSTQHIMPISWVAKFDIYIKFHNIGNTGQIPEHAEKSLPNILNTLYEIHLKIFFSTRIFLFNVRRECILMFPMMEDGVSKIKATKVL